MFCEKAPIDFPPSHGNADGEKRSPHGFPNVPEVNPEEERKEAGQGQY